MNKKFQQFVPICLILAAVLIVIVVITMCKPKIEEYSAIREEVERNSAKKLKLEEQVRKEEADKQAQEIKLRALKPIFKTTVNNADNLGVFGNMFEDIIKMAQSNGLLIRSIEYNMKPTNDPLYAENSGNYNACELKFFFVGTYSQMRDFLNDMNNNFEYLTSIASLSITAFQEDANYLLINEAITLYSEKPAVTTHRGRR